MELMNIHYYFREKHYQSAIKESSNVSDPSVAIFKAFCLTLNDSVNNALETLRPFLNHPKSSVGAIMASIFAHNHCHVLDKESIRELESSLRNAKRNADTYDLYYEGLYNYLAGHLGKAQNVLEEALTKDTKSSKNRCLLGWVEIAQKKPKAALAHFKSALQFDKNNMDALMGEVESLSPVDALSKVNSLVVQRPKAVIPLIEKMKLQLANRQWDNAADTALRTLGLQSDNIFAMEMRALKFLLFGKYDEVVSILRKLHDNIVKQEPKAHWIMMRVVSAFSRCCGSNAGVISELEAFVKSALKTGSLSFPVILEAGRFYLIAGKTLDAESMYKEGAKMDEASLAFLGLTEVGVAQNGLSSDVKEQIEFLIELDEMKDDPRLLIMTSLLKPEQTLELLDKAVSLLQNRSSQFNLGIDYLIALDPELLINIAHTYPDNKIGEKRKLRTLNLVVETCPGLLKANIELVRVQLSLGDNNEAAATLNNILDNIDNSNPEAHLLFAQLNMNKGDYDQVNSILEQGLSHNLQIRDYPAFHMLSGLVSKHSGDNAACITHLKQALLTKTTHNFSLDELGTIYSELSAAYVRQNQFGLACDVLTEAQERLKSSEQEFVITIAKAHLTATEGKVQKAMSLLNEVPQRSPHFLKAQIQKANIYLTHLKDGHGYATCYKKLVEIHATPENMLLLGDAYMAIQEPELAIQNYEKAMQSNSGNSKLNCKLARMLVKCHQYHKAIKCYKTAGEEGSVELAELFLKLGQPDKAEQILLEYTSPNKAVTLAKVYEKLGDLRKALKVLNDSLEETGRSNLEWSAKLCQQMAVYSSQLHDYNNAIDHYKRALTYHPGDHLIQIALAKLYMEVNDWNSCEMLCKSLLAKDPQNEPALIMVADLALRRVDLVSAMNHFTSLLDRRPNYWVALARLVEVSRRYASLSRSLPYLEAAKLIEPNHPGLHYCYGLYHWYDGDSQMAVQSFNAARGDAEWGSQAVHNMVEVCMGQSAAHKLLAELKPQNHEEETGLLLLTSFVRLASHDRTEVERAIIDFTALANNDTFRVGSTLGLGMGYLEQGQASRAKTMLKRVAKHPWSLEEAEYLERCWLLLGELYIQAGSQQQAADLLHRVITHNQSSAKAYELLGMIAEKEQNYYKACQNFQQAWNVSGKSDPGLGYKLAYNQLKSKRYAEAVATCQKVLSTHPNYPKIKKEILDKAVPRLRS